MATVGKKENRLSAKPSQFLNIKDCSMNSVVVYRDRAEVKRDASISIGEGETEIIVTGLSEAVDGDSVRVEGQGSATILDVIYSTKQEKTEEDSNKIESENIHKSLVQQIKEKDKEIKHLEFHQTAIEKQKELLGRYSKQVIEMEQELNKDSTSDSFSSLINPNTVSTVLEFMKQYENRVASLDERLHELQENKKKLTEEKNVIVSKADKINPKKKKDKLDTIRTIKITLGANDKCDVKLTLSYVVTNASWKPAYDIRVFTKDKTMKLHYYGMIKQSTGEDWDNANISLSTAQPDIGGSAPQLGIHHIGFVRPRALAVRKMNKSGFGGRGVTSQYGSIIERGDEMECCMLLGDSNKSLSKAQRKSRRRSYSPPPMEVEVAEVESGQLYNTTYKIPRTSNIPADNTEHKVTVAIIDLSPDFSYISVPKKSPLSFLQAKVKNDSPYAFLNGPANVFLDNNFLAKTELSDTSPGEDFTSSLGVDQSIRITTQPVSIIRGMTGRLTKNNLITYTHVYIVKNTQSNTIKLMVLDQFPLSTDERLKVVMVDPDIKKQGVSVQFSHGSVVLNDDNNVEWKCTIPQDTEIDLQLIFSVEFPPNDVVEGLQS